MISQFLGAIGALAATLDSLSMATIYSVLLLIVGAFIYIGTALILPEIRDNTDVKPNKVLSKSSKVYNKRQSFDERICDDLSEVILQYLPLESKLRLECVSKQFQRTILGSQRTLDIVFMTKITKDKNGLSSDLWIQKLGMLLRKLPVLTSVKHRIEYFSHKIDSPN